MKEKYKKIMHKTEFCNMLSKKLGVKRKSITNYFEKNDIPIKHLEKINKALDLRLKLDDKIKEIEVNAFLKL